MKPHPTTPLLVLKPMLELLIVALFVGTFIAQPFRIPSESMVPTLRVGDLLLADKQSFAPAGPLDRLLLPPTTPHRNDLALFHYPADPSTTLVKRIIALPGDRLHLHHGRVWLNGAPLAEPFAVYTPSRFNTFRDEFPSLREADPNLDPRWWATLRRTLTPSPGNPAELIVPPGHYFVLGDNRNDSEDSRYWGFVPAAALIGRPLLVYLSFAGPNPPAPQEPHTVAQRILHRLQARVLR
jgi:signal peptidase I